MSSLSAFSLSSRAEISNPQFLTHKLQLSLKPSFFNPLNNYELFSLPFRPPKPFTFRRLSHSATKISQSNTSNPMNPFVCKLSNTNSSLSLQNNLVKILAENILCFCVGSFVFFGCFNVRAARAVTAQTRSSNVISEENNEEMSEKILEEEPRNAEALKVVLYGKMRKGKTKEAVKYVERLIDVEPEEVEWRLLLALCHEMMGQLGKAKRLFKEILKERPLLVKALHGLALVMHKNHEGPAVFDMLENALDIARREKRVTEERNIKILIAEMHVVKGELEDGLKRFQDLVNEDPRDFRPYLFQGIIYSLLNKKEEAAEQFEIYRTLVPDEFPQRGFLDDVVLTAKTKSQEFRKEFDAEFSYPK